MCSWKSIAFGLLLSTLNTVRTLHSFQLNLLIRCLTVNTVCTRSLYLYPVSMNWFSFFFVVSNMFFLLLSGFDAEFYLFFVCFMRNLSWFTICCWLFIWCFIILQMIIVQWCFGFAICCVCFGIWEFYERIFGRNLPFF